MLLLEVMVVTDSVTFGGNEKNRQFLEWRQISGESDHFEIHNWVTAVRCEKNSFFSSKCPNDFVFLKPFPECTHRADQFGESKHFLT